MSLDEIENTTPLYSWEQRLGKRCPCGKCQATPMLGMSWWKNLGFNTATPCAVALRAAGYRDMSWDS